MTTTRHERTLYDYYYYVNSANALADGKGFVDPHGTTASAPHPPLTLPG